MRRQKLRLRHLGWNATGVIRSGDVSDFDGTLNGAARQCLRRDSSHGRRRKADGDYDLQIRDVFGAMQGRGSHQPIEQSAEARAGEATAWRKSDKKRAARRNLRRPGQRPRWPDDGRRAAPDDYLRDGPSAWPAGKTHAGHHRRSPRRRAYIFAVTSARLIWSAFID